MKLSQLVKVYYWAAMCLGLMNTATNGADSSRAAPGNTKWLSGSGSWIDAARWSGGLPNAYQRVEVHGNGTVVVPSGTYVIANMQVGIHRSFHY